MQNRPPVHLRRQLRQSSRFNRWLKEWRIRIQFCLLLSRALGRENTTPQSQRHHNAQPYSKGTSEVQTPHSKCEGLPGIQPWFSRPHRDRNAGGGYGADLCHLEAELPAGSAAASLRSRRRAAAVSCCDPIRLFIFCARSERQGRNLIVESLRRRRSGGIDLDQRFEKSRR